MKDSNRFKIVVPNYRGFGYAATFQFVVNQTNDRVIVNGRMNTKPYTHLYSNEHTIGAARNIYKNLQKKGSAV